MSYRKVTFNLAQANAMVLLLFTSFHRRGITKLQPKSPHAFQGRSKTMLSGVWVEELRTVRYSHPMIF